MLRDELIAEINRARNSDELALWAYRRFAAKNTLPTDDSKAVEKAYLAVLKAQTPPITRELNQYAAPGPDAGQAGR